MAENYAPLLQASSLIREYVCEIVASDLCMDIYRSLPIDDTVRKLTELVKDARICYIPSKKGIGELTSRNTGMILGGEFFASVEGGIWIKRWQPLGRISEEIDVGELSMSFSRLKARKSPGMDGIMGAMWRNVFLAVPSYIEKLP